MKIKSALAALWISFVPAAALAASGTIYFDTGGSATNSGTTDSNSATASGTAAAWTTGTNSVVLDTNTNLTGLAVDGSQAIYLNSATNSNFKIFWITGITGCTGTGACTVTTSGAPAAPTCGTCAAVSWAIGGRMVYTSANWEAGIRAGDTMQFNNSPASKSTLFITKRVSGDVTTGPITVQGKTGVLPKLTSTAAGIVSGTFSSWHFSNLEFAATTSAAVVETGSGDIFDGIKVSSGGNCFTITTNIIRVVNSELTGCTGDGVSSTGTSIGIISGNYIHGVGGNGITNTAAGVSGAVTHNIIAGNTGKGILLSGAPSNAGLQLEINGNTVYGNNDNGLEVSNAWTALILRNNIFLDNGDTGTEFNVKWTGVAEYSTDHSYNVFSIAGSRGGGNVSGLTANSTESTSDPLLTNPSGGDFTISSASSSAAGTGYPGQFIGGSLSYRDIGAVNRAAVGASAATGKLGFGVGK